MITLEYQIGLNAARLSVIEHAHHNTLNAIQRERCRIGFSGFRQGSGGNPAVKIQRTMNVDKRWRGTRRHYSN